MWEENERTTSYSLLAMYPGLSIVLLFDLWLRHVVIIIGKVLYFWPYHRFFACISLRDWSKSMKGEKGGPEQVEIWIKKQMTHPSLLAQN